MFAALVLAALFLPVAAGFALRTYVQTIAASVVVALGFLAGLTVVSGGTPLHWGLAFSLPVVGVVLPIVGIVVFLGVMAHTVRRLAD